MLFGRAPCWAGVGRAACALVSFVQVVGPRLVLVVFLFRVGGGRPACVWRPPRVGSLARRLALVDTVEIWQKART